MRPPRSPPRSALRPRCCRVPPTPSMFPAPPRVMAFSLPPGRPRTLPAVWCDETVRLVRWPHHCRRDAPSCQPDRFGCMASKESTPDVSRRSERSRRAIFDAALALVGEVGYPKTTVEGIAARAGVGKQTIYRWWRSKADVLLDA